MTSYSSPHGHDGPEWLAPTGRYDATHKVIDVDGREIRPGYVIGDLDGPVIFRLLTRVPGDGTATNGKIIVDEPGWPGAERYPSVYGLSVVPRVSDEDDEDIDDHEIGCTCIYCVPGA